MTLTERVLRHLEETSGAWRIVGFHLLRRDDGKPLGNTICSLKDMGVLVFGRLYWKPDEEMLRIMHTSDGPRNTSYDPALRAAMLEAAGLEEEEA